MIWLDIVLLAPLIWGAYKGFKKGLIARAISPFLNPLYAPHINGANKTISNHIIL